MKKDGKPCKNYVVKGRTRCKHHGGKTHPGGPGHPTYKHGKTSKFLPGKLGEKFLEAYNDPELLSHRKYAAMFDVRVRQLCERLYTGEAGHLWAELQGRNTELEAAESDIRDATELARRHREAAAQAASDAERDAIMAEARKADEARSAAAEQFGKALTKVRETIKKGAKEEQNWRELVGMADEASAMKMRETKRLESERMMVPIMEVMTLISVLHANTREAAESLLPPDKSKQLMIRVGDTMNRLLHGPGGGGRDLHKLPANGYGADSGDKTVDGKVVDGGPDSQSSDSVARDGTHGER